MNGRKAKAMRKAIKKAMPKAPQCSYEQTEVHAKAYPVLGKYTALGQPETRLMQVGTTALSKGCQRSMYKTLKAAAKNGEFK